MTLSEQTIEKDVVQPENTAKFENTNTATPMNVAKSESTVASETFNTLPENKLDSIFTRQGRLNRWRFFTKSLKLIVLSFIGGILSPFGLILVLASFFGSICITVRRLHDLNKSGWFSLVSFIPYVNFIFALYVLLAKGTDGVNKYGRDPLV